MNGVDPASLAAALVLADGNSPVVLVFLKQRNAEALPLDGRALFMFWLVPRRRIELRFWP
jgi:hypothetical protein